MEYTDFRPIATAIRKELKKEFPNCKFSVKTDRYGGELTVLKAPASWYTSKFLEDRVGTMGYVSLEKRLPDSEKLTKKGQEALLRLKEIMIDALKYHTTTYYDEGFPQSVKYAPIVYIFGKYTEPFEVFNDTMKGYHSTPTKSFAKFYETLKNKNAEYGGRYSIVVTVPTKAEVESLISDGKRYGRVLSVLGKNGYVLTFHLNQEVWKECDALSGRHQMKAKRTRTPSKKQCPIKVNFRKML